MATNDWCRMNENELNEYVYAKDVVRGHTLSLNKWYFKINNNNKCIGFIKLIKYRGSRCADEPGDYLATDGLYYQSSCINQMINSFKDRLFFINKETTFKYLISHSKNEK